MQVNVRPLVIRGARLIDGNGGQPIDRTTVVIENHRISRVAVGPVDFPTEARILDAEGKTIMPGLIDNHVHYRDLCGELFLAHGVTSVRDLGNPIDWILAQRDAVAMGKVAGPRIFCAGGGFYGTPTAGHHMVATSPYEARKITRRLIAMGVDYAKTHLGVPLDIIRAVAGEAHEVGFRVTGHLDSSIVPYIEAGIDGVEHASGCAEATIRSEAGRKGLAAIKLWLAKFLGPWTLAERKYFPEVTECLARKGTFIEPTMVLWGASQGRRKKWEWEDYELLKDPGLSYLAENARLLWLNHYYTAYGARAKAVSAQDVVFGNRYSIYGILPEAQMREGCQREGEFVCQLVKAGGNVVTGTDAPAVIPGLSLHREMEFLVEAGLSPMQAIMAATKVGARYLGKEDELGTVEEGKLADIVVVNGDPLRDLREAQKIETVIKNGEIIDTAYHPGFFNPIPRFDCQEFYGYPVPQLRAVSPNIAVEKDAGIDVKLQGTDFFPASSVRFGGTRIPSRFTSQRELVARIPAHLLRVGTIPIYVVNPRPHVFPDRGATSNALGFTVMFAKSNGSA
ncbi:MAG: amidohydrolase family protein [Candidatus Binatia bacterium]